MGSFCNVLPPLSCRSYYQKDVKHLGAQMSNGKLTPNMTLAVINV